MDEKEIELREVWGFMKDFWQVVKKHYHADTNDETACAALINDTNDLADKYRNDLCRSLVLTFLWHKDGTYFERGGGRNYEQAIETGTTEAGSTGCPRSAAETTKSA